MTSIYCDFIDCIYNKNKLCGKEAIRLDENVANINIGCPDAEWRSERMEQMLIDALRFAPDKGMQVMLLKMYAQKYGMISDENREIVRQIMMERSGDTE